MSYLKVLTLSVALASVILLAACAPNSVPTVDLDAVLGVTSKTMESYGGAMEDAKAMDGFTDELQSNLNATNPKIYPEMISVTLKDDGSIEGYHDANKNTIQDTSESVLFKLEVDSEKNRLLASASDQVREHGFSGTGLLTGLLIGNLLSRQRSAGIDPKSLSSKQAMSNSAYKSAKSRSGSGSHSKGK